ncbi:hypothetical protein BJV74DRAFT_795602 [Russula compacta]|nr:hypothetical protein BJV74DRAFT_795602 [Russula compacta]
MNMNNRETNVSTKKRKEVKDHALNYIPAAELVLGSFGCTLFNSESGRGTGQGARGKAGEVEVVVHGQAQAGGRWRRAGMGKAGVGWSFGHTHFNSEGKRGTGQGVRGEAGKVEVDVHRQKQACVGRWRQVIWMENPAPFSILDRWGGGGGGGCTWAGTVRWQVEASGHRQSRGRLVHMGDGEQMWAGHTLFNLGQEREALGKRPEMRLSAHPGEPSLNLGNVRDKAHAIVEEQAPAEHPHDMPPDSFQTSATSTKKGSFNYDCKKGSFLMRWANITEFDVWCQMEDSQ